MRHSTIMSHINNKVLALNNSVALSFIPLSPAQVAGFTKAANKRVDTRIEVLIYNLDGKQIYSYPSISKAAANLGMTIKGLNTDIYVGRNLQGKVYT